jgi:hypothetical protein
MRLYLRRFPGEAITVENTERQTVTAAVAVIAPPPDREGEWHQWPSPAMLYAVDLDGQGRVVPVDLAAVLKPAALGGGRRRSLRTR